MAQQLGQPHPGIALTTHAYLRGILACQQALCLHFLGEKVAEDVEPLGRTLLSDYAELWRIQGRPPAIWNRREEPPS